MAGRGQLGATAADDGVHDARPRRACHGTTAPAKGGVRAGQQRAPAAGPPTFSAHPHVISRALHLALLATAPRSRAGTRIFDERAGSWLAVRAADKRSCLTNA